MDNNRNNRNNFAESIKLENNDRKEVESPVQVQETAVPEPKKARVANAISVNVRRGMNVESERIRTVKAGMECKILRVTNEWAQVEFPDQVGRYGYMPYKYLEEIK